MSKLSNALKNIVMDIDEEGYAADRLLSNLGVPDLHKEDETEEEFDRICDREGELTTAAILILIVDTILGFELKAWFEALKLVLKYGI